MRHNAHALRSKIGERRWVAACGGCGWHAKASDEKDAARVIDEPKQLGLALGGVA